MDSSTPRRRRRSLDRSGDPRGAAGGLRRPALPPTSSSSPRSWASSAPRRPSPSTATRWAPSPGRSATTAAPRSSREPPTRRRSRRTWPRVGLEERPAHSRAHLELHRAVHDAHLNPDGPPKGEVSVTMTLVLNVNLVPGQDVTQKWVVDSETGVGATQLRMTVEVVTYGGAAGCGTTGDGGQGTATAIWGAAG